SNSGALRDEVIAGGGAEGLRNPGRYLLRVERSRGGRKGKWLAGARGEGGSAIALTLLAKHYGLIASDAAARRKTGSRHWGPEDYRPTLDAWGARINWERTNGEGVGRERALRRS